MPSVLLAAAVLAVRGVSFVLIGSVALRLRGESIPVGDVDVVIEPQEGNLRRLRSVLASMALRPRSIPPPRDLAWLDLVTVTTSFGNVDCLLERGRLDWDRLRGSATVLSVTDAPVIVAGASEAWALRSEFKG